MNTINNIQLLLLLVNLTYLLKILIFFVTITLKGMISSKSLIKFESSIKLSHHNLVIKLVLFILLLCYT
jgi:hypothetical protein